MIHDFSIFSLDKYNPYPTDKTTGPSSPKRAKRNGQPTKKQRTSPRFMKISHKLNSRSHVFVPKTKAKCTKLKDITFVASNKHAKSSLNHETMKISHKLPVGLCQTKHKSHEICSLCSKRFVDFVSICELNVYLHECKCVEFWCSLTYC